MFPPCIDSTLPPPNQILKRPPCFQHLWETLSIIKGQKTLGNFSQFSTFLGLLAWVAIEMPNYEPSLNHYLVCLLKYFSCITLKEDVSPGKNFALEDKSPDKSFK